MSEQSRPELNNVVQLKVDRSGGAPAQIPLTRLPAAMHSVRDKARQLLQGLLRDLFDKVDDAMFELADKAGNNHEQNLYFDSMREVRLRRRDMDAIFFRNIDIRFARLLDHTAFREELALDNKEYAVEELSLVKNDDLEEMVAIDSMINKANEKFAEAIQHLTLRIDHLVPIKVYQKNNPLGVNVICHAFHEATKSLDIDVKAKLVLYKLFDNMVMTKLEGVFQSLNRQLMESNILPSLKQDTRAKPRSSASSPDASEHYGAGISANLQNSSTNTQSGQARSAEGSAIATTYDEQTNQVLHGLRDLLGARNNTPVQHRVGEEIASQELIKILSRAQQQNTFQQISSGSGAPHINIRELLQSLLRASDHKEQSINQVDDDVINLVSMMFDFILDDRNLAAPMKALIGRLQIPMVKVAIADKSFFSKGGHPARRLLNEMAMAALGWQESNEDNQSKDSQRKDNLYIKMESIVQSILSDFEADMGIFNNLLMDFRSFLDKDKRRAQILEQRTIDAEDGKAKSEAARSQVDSVLNRITSGQDLPLSAQKLLRDAWGNVLFITTLKQGAESSEWQAAVRTAQQLVWSLSAPMNKENRQALLKLMPELLQKLRKGLEEISYSPFEATQLFKQLEILHMARLRSAVKMEQAQQAVEKTASPNQASSSQAAGSPVQTKAAVSSGKTQSQKIQPEVPAANLKQKNDEAVKLPVSDEKSVVPAAESVKNTSIEALETVVITSDTSAAAAEGDLPAGDQHLALVGNITQGSWFEMHGDDGQQYRCRLAAIIRATGKYIFVNRSGMKVSEETRMSLAQSLKSGRLHLLDDGMLFDRALEAVIGNLRKK
jgi:hypothetical protein